MKDEMLFLMWDIKHRMSCMNYCWSDGSAWTITGVCVCVCVCVCS